jgi:hypothetical protein
MSVACACGALDNTWLGSWAPKQGSVPRSYRGGQLGYHLNIVLVPHARMMPGGQVQAPASWVNLDAKQTGRALRPNVPRQGQRLGQPGSELVSMYDVFASARPPPSQLSISQELGYITPPPPLTQLCGTRHRDSQFCDEAATPPGAMPATGAMTAPPPPPPPGPAPGTPRAPNSAWRASPAPPAAIPPPPPIIWCA